MRSLSSTFSPVIYFDALRFMRWFVNESALPRCLKCNTGQLIPLSDYGAQGGAVYYKAWVCTSPDCGFNIKIRNGAIYLNEPIADGAANAHQWR